MTERVVNTKAIIVLILLAGMALAAVAMQDRAHATSGATLTALSVGTGTLSPAFDADTLMYDVTGLSNSNDTLTVTATPATGYNVGMWVGSGRRYCERTNAANYPGGSGVWVRNRPIGEASTGTDEPLKVGRNIIEIYVAEADNPHSGSPGVRTYEVHVVRPGNLSISGPTEVTHPEKDTSTIATYSVPDATGTISWDQDGDDSGGNQSLFSISDSGALSFAYSLSSSDPWDCDEDNVYEVTMRAYEDSTLVAMLDVAVTIPGNSPPEGHPTITGNAQVGQTLTADTSGISDPDGMDNVTYTYHWLNYHNFAPIRHGEAGSTYTVQSSDVGKRILLAVSFTDDAGYQENVQSTPTDAVVPVNSPATGAPTISGTAEVGQRLTANTSEISDADGLNDVLFTYQWLADDTEISGATSSTNAASSTYTLQPSDAGKVIKVRVTFTDHNGNAESLTSEGTAAVAPANTPATGQPTITGTAQVGQTLTASTSHISDADGLTNVSYSYQWLSGRDAEITGATSSTYEVQSSDNGKIIKVRVDFTDDAGNAESLTSEGTSAVVMGGL